MQTPVIVQDVNIIYREYVAKFTFLQLFDWEYLSILP